MKPLIDVKELSKRLCIATGTLYNWKSKGLIPFKKVRGCLRFDWDEVEDKLLKHGWAATRKPS
jgi:predicted site-specific integrase-resolvase